jgi:hypothetical protein
MLFFFSRINKDLHLTLVQPQTAGPEKRTCRYATTTSIPTTITTADGKSGDVNANLATRYSYFEVASSGGDNDDDDDTVDDVCDVNGDKSPMLTQAEVHQTGSLWEDKDDNDDASPTSQEDDEEKERSYVEAE